VGRRGGHWWLTSLAVALATGAGCGARSEIFFGTTTTGSEGNSSSSCCGSGTSAGTTTGTSTSTVTGADGGPTVCPICSTGGWCWQNPLPQGNSLVGVWGSSESDIWAAGGPTIIHWNGSAWCAAVTDDFVGYSSVWGDAADDVWTVGYDRVEHWDGTTWSPSYSSDANLALYGVGGSGPSDVWAVGFYNTADENAGHAAILHFDGSAWSLVELPESVSFNEVGSVWSSGPSDVWFGVSQGSTPTALLHFDGSAWTSVSIPGAQGVGAIWGRSASDVWAVASTGAVGSLVAHWEGTAWSTSLQAPMNLSSIRGTSAGDVWVVGVDATGSSAIAEHWDGTAWSESPLGGFSRVLPEGGPAGLWIAPTTGGGGDVLWAVGSDGTVATGTGAALASQTSGSDADLAAVWADAPDDAWAVGGTETSNATTTATILHWNGTTWSPASLPASVTSLNGALSAVWGSGPADVWAAGTAMGAFALHWDGNVWSEVALPPLVYIAALSGTGSNDVWGAGFAGMGGVVVHWDGAAWTSVLTVPPGAGDSGDSELLAVWAIDPADVWAVGIDDTIEHWDGSAWTGIVAMDSNNLEGVWASGPDDVWILDQSGGVLRGNASGLALVTSPLSGGDGSFSIWGTSTDDVWIVAANVDDSNEPTLVHWDGTSFSASSTDSEYFSAVSGSSPGDVWLVGGAGQILHHS